MTRLTAVSLFAGVGGIDLALERAGVKVVAAVEIDNAARGVLADRFPNTTLFPDVTKVTADDLRATGFVPERGIVCAGWPCQGNSVAGRRQGLADPRSGLWSHVVRLLDELRPRWFLGENVPGLLSVTDGEDFGRVLQDVADLGMGFAYRVLDAQFFGVPQRRRRVFIVGHLGDARRPVEILLEPEGSEGDSAPGDAAREAVAGAAPVGLEVVGGQDGIANCVTAREGKGPDSDATTTLVVSALTSNGVGTCGADDNQAQANHLLAYRKAQRAHDSEDCERWQLDDTADTLDAGGHTARTATAVVQSLALRGREDGAQLEVGPEGGPYNALRAGDGGSSRQSLVAVTAFSHTAGIDLQADEGLAPTMKAGHDTMPSVAETVRTHPRPGSNSNGAMVATETTVRRLTPLECERLQGFPDNWTATSNGKPQADSPRYKRAADLGRHGAAPRWATPSRCHAWSGLRDGS